MESRKPAFPLAMMFSPSTCHKRSFTIVELLIVILLLAVIAGLAIPNFGSTFKNLQLSQMAKTISSVMYYAQTRSIMKAKGHRLVLTLTIANIGWKKQQIPKRVKTLFLKRFLEDLAGFFASLKIFTWSPIR